MKTKEEKCIITGVRLTEKDTYNLKGYPYANFVEKFRSRYKIPVSELRMFVGTLKSRL